MLAGLMAGSQPIAQAAIVDISTPQTKAKNIGLISFASSIGFVIGPAFGGYFSDSQIVSWFNFSTPFFCSAGAAILNALMLQLYFKDTYAPLKKKIFFRLSNVLKLFSEAFARPEIKNISIAFFLSELAWALYFQVIPLFLAAVYSTTPSGIGLFMSFVGLLFGMSTMLITRILVGSFPPRSLIITGFFIAGLGMLAPIAATTIGWQWAASLPIIFGMSISYNLLLTLYSNVVGTDEQGWVMGISSSLVAMAWVAGAIVITGLSSFSLWVPFIVAGILEIICAVILLTDV
jgi:predicted MFS family arabinose efflux permease